jgi:hypothetical protein
MPFLAISGVELPVAEWSCEEVRIGEADRALSGAVHSDARTFKKVWHHLRTPPMTKANADAYRGLIRGDGHTWSFDASSLAGSTGSVLESNGTETYPTASPAPKHGARYVNVPPGGGLTGTVGGFAAWGAMFWRYDYAEDGGGNILSPSWQHWFLGPLGVTVSVPSGGSALIPETVLVFQYAGVPGSATFSVLPPGASATTWDYALGVTVGEYVVPTSNPSDLYFECVQGGLTHATTEPTWTSYGATGLISDGTVQWRLAGRASSLVDDLVFFPYDPTPLQSSLYAAHQTTAFSLLPKLSATGDLFASGSATLMGEVGPIRSTPYMSAGTWNSTAVSFEFSLREF